MAQLITVTAADGSIADHNSEGATGGITQTRAAT